MTMAAGNVALLTGLEPAVNINPFSALPPSQLLAIFQTLLKSLNPQDVAPKPATKTRHFPVDENFLLMLESLTPGNLVQKPVNLSTDAEYKQWNAQRQRENRRKLNVMLENSTALQRRLKTELAENVIRLRQMLYHDHAKVAVKRRVGTFLGIGPAVVDIIPELNRYVERYSEQRRVLAEVDVEPKSSIFREQVSKLEKKYSDYKKNRIESRIPGDLRKKLADARMRAMCYDFFMDGKRVKKVINELQINEAELNQNVEAWLQSIVIQLKQHPPPALPSNQ